MSILFNLFEISNKGLEILECDHKSGLLTLFFQGMNHLYCVHFEHMFFL